MSLINEALKKAQKQRTGDSTPLPAIGGESAERIARRSKPSGFNTLLLWAGIGGVVLTGVIVAGIFFLRKPPSAPVATTAPAPVVTPASAPVAAATTPKPTEPVAVPAASAPATSTPAPAFVVATTTAPTPPVTPKNEAPAPLVLPVPATSTHVAAADVAAAPKPEPAKPALPGKLEPRAINFIESLRIAGIRASSTDAKVLMNDRVYRIGSVVEAEMGLKLVGIATHSLTFEDDNGASYTRTF